MFKDNENTSSQLPEPSARSDEMSSNESPAPSAREELYPTRLRAETGQGSQPRRDSPQGSSLSSAETAVTSSTPPLMLEAKEPLLGSLVGSFRLVRKLGNGGMGSVYLGEHTRIGSKVAVKFLHDHFASNEVLVQRFQAEARAVNLIGHENIINIFDMDVLPPRRHFLLMEYLEGHSLATMTGRPTSPELAVSIITQVCDALQAAHLNGVVHRDLKPENILLVRHDRVPHFVKVLDFGIAKLLDPGQPVDQTAAGMIIGTPEYMAPEQWYGHCPDGRTDLYALGILTYELLVGCSPFGKGRIGSLMHAHLMEHPPAPHEVRPEVPVALSEAVMRAMAKCLEDRYQDAAQMREALEQALAKSCSSHRSTAAVHAISTPPPHGAEARKLNLPPLSRQATPPPSPVPMPVGLGAWVSLQPGSPPVKLDCTNLAHGGAFLCTDSVPPPLRSRVSLTLELQDRKLPCKAEVVHHVSSSQARTWKTRAGFAVQFIHLSKEDLEVLGSVAQGRPPKPPAPAITQDDPQADVLLGILFRRMKSDPYALFCLPLDASFEDVRKHLRSTLSYLGTVSARPLSPRQIQDLREMHSRVENAAEVLGHARKRIEHDAWRSNFAGVARCISSGVSATELEVLRARYLKDHPGADAIEQIHTRTAMAWESQGRIDMALAEYERALRANPLRLWLQQRYWTLKQRGVKSTSSAEPLPDSDAAVLWQSSEPA